MRLLLFSDVHRDLGAVRRLVELADEADVLVGAGDFGVCREGTAETLRPLQEVGRPVVLVPGNAESDEELARAAADLPDAHVLHGSGVEIGGVRFWGLGGGVPVTPFGSWSWDHTEDAARDLLAGCPEGAVLVTHSPPKGIADRDNTGNSLGSVAVRECIEAKSPRVVACGHIHASWGRRESVNGSEVVNAGPGGVMVEVE